MRNLLAVIFALSTFSCQSISLPVQQNISPSNINTADTKTQNETERLNKWFDVKYEEFLQMNPILLTIQGRKEKYDQVGDWTEGEEIRQLKWKGGTVVELKSLFNYNKLDEEAKTSYELWIYQYEEALKDQSFFRNKYIFTQLDGAHSFAAQFLINFHKVDSEADMDAYIKRISGVSKGISDLLIIAKLNASKGVRPPRFAYEGVIKVSENLLNGIPFTEGNKDSSLWADIKKKVSTLVEKGKIDKNKAIELKSEARQALVTNFKPSYDHLISWLQDDINNISQIAQGVGSHPNGKDFYNFRLKMNTSSNLTADEIHQIGWDEVERLTNEMEIIKNKLNFKGDMKDFFTFFKKDEQFFYPNTDEGRRGYITVNGHLNCPLYGQ